MKEMNQKTPRKCFNVRGRERNRVLSGLGSGFQSGSDHLQSPSTTGNPGSVIVPQYGSSKITVFVWGKNIILKFLGNTK